MRASSTPHFFCAAFYPAVCATFCGAAFFAAPNSFGQTVACLNNSYSAEQEIEVRELTGDITKFIMGQHPEHSDPFWYHELRRTEDKIASNPNDFEAANDRAVALTKLKRYTEAESAFLSNEQQWPGRYKTASNLGVLYKKTKRYEEGKEATREALRIKPSGHLGLGDYYLKMLAWRAKVDADPSEFERTNFLGIPRSDTPSAVATNPIVNEQHLVTLIQADRHFADTYCVLGDVLMSKGDIPNAARAYQRAAELEPVLERINVYLERLNTYAKKASAHNFDVERDAVVIWKAEYQAAEFILLAKRDVSDTPPLAKEVFRTMKKRKVQKPVFEESKMVTVVQKPPIFGLMKFAAIVAGGLLFLRLFLFLPFMRPAEEEPADAPSS